jgi:hypothetical protein
MINNALSVLLAAVVLAALQILVAFADDVPRLDFTRTCRAEASAVSDAAAAACMADEQKARDQLIKDWEGFASALRSSCTAEATDIAGIRSYVELLTCLQVEREAGKLPKE